MSKNYSKNRCQNHKSATNNLHIWSFETQQIFCINHLLLKDGRFKKRFEQGEIAKTDLLVCQQKM